jgi:hypothetical protein
MNGSFHSWCGIVVSGVPTCEIASMLYCSGYAVNNISSTQLFILFTDLDIGLAGKQIWSLYK